MTNLNYRDGQYLYAFDTDRIQADNANGFLLAKRAVEALDSHYPGWGWHAMVRGGVLMIRLPHVSGKWGMNTRLTEFDHDATAFKKRVINAGGEFLERAGRKRAGFGGERITHVDGMQGRG